MYYGICTKCSARTGHIIDHDGNEDRPKSTRTKSTYKQPTTTPPPGAGEKLQNLELLFQLHHQCPVGLQQIVTEVVLACVDALARYLSGKSGDKTRRRID